jgi:hypothetical protein
MEWVQTVVELVMKPSCFVATIAFYFPAVQKNVNESTASMSFLVVNDVNSNPYMCTITLALILTLTLIMFRRISVPSVESAL